LSVLLEQQRAIAHFLTGHKSENVSGKTHGSVNHLSVLPEQFGLPALKHAAENRFADTQRYQIYRNNYLISLRTALADTYPVINKLVGDEFFYNVAREYIQYKPAHDGNVHEFGDEFAGFLSDFPGLETLAYLRDVARLEWAYHEVFHAQESTTLDVQALAAIEGEASEQLRFHVSGHCRLVASEFPVLQIWRVNQPAQNSQATTTIDLADGGEQLVVMRQGLEVVFVPVTREMVEFLMVLSEGVYFTSACERLMDSHPDCDIGMLLNEAIELKWLTDFSC